MAAAFLFGFVAGRLGMEVRAFRGGLLAFGQHSPGAAASPRWCPTARPLLPHRRAAAGSSNRRRAQMAVTDRSQDRTRATGAAERNARRLRIGAAAPAVSWGRLRTARSFQRAADRAAVAAHGQHFTAGRAHQRAIIRRSTTHQAAVTLPAERIACTATQAQTYEDRGGDLRSPAFVKSRPC